MSAISRRLMLKAGVAAMAAAGNPSQAQTVRGVTPQAIRLGAMNSMTGALASYGIPIRAGTVAYLGAVNAAGGVNGRKIELVGEDNVFSTPQSLAIARKMAQARHGYLFANSRATRLKLLVHDGFGLWCAARRLNESRFVWPREARPRVLRR